MLIRTEFIDRLAETLEGMAVSNARETSPNQREASVLVYRPSAADIGGPVAGESPLLEINMIETGGSACVIVTSALGIAEMHGVNEVRLLAATEEAAFYSRETSSKISVLTVSSRGSIQVYMNIAESLADMELTDVNDDDLRAAVALKIFAEHAEIFRDEK
ncbi:MAG TPA: hypothetical protein VFX22_03395 [Candidatus Kapabacteria bacterium]|nr:hypothetical protein [Candidatus Kapabacteria bacterium]